MLDLTFAIKAWIDEVARNTSTVGVNVSLSPSQNNESTTVVDLPRLRPKASGRRPSTSTGRGRHGRCQSRTVTFSDNAGSRARSRSPVKTVADLRFAKIEIRDLDGEVVFDSLPESARNLIMDLREIEDGMGIIPPLIRKEVEAASRRKLQQNHLLTTQYHLTRDEALLELQGLLRLVAGAKSCKAEEQSEAAWNTVVHYPVFQLALAGPVGRSVKPWVTTTAKIVSDVVPRTGNAESGGGTVAKLIDFCLTIEPKDPVQVENILFQQPNYQLRTFNQSMYTPLRFRPIAIAVESKIDTASSTGETQLAIWTRAWLNRMSMLLQLPYNASLSSPPLPLIRIQSHMWYVLIGYLEDNTAEQQQREQRHQDEDGFYDHESTDAPEARQLDEQEQEQEQDFDAAPTPTINSTQKKLVIVGEQIIGDTRTVIGAYKLLKSIRRLVDWAEGDFRKYIDEVVIPTATELWVPS
ncbi:hypothetical protein GGR51DRAFT_564128 [Nemania sp. FL0031]|nr:hypothetical protein GGR51DRAFT_564128 [Nemania sp. FL0031]